jgi:RHS repeat-associated protein
VYDAVGNFLQMQHRGTDPAHSGWTRRYTYSETSLIEGGKQNNRLSSTQVGNGVASAAEAYLHDLHGNMVRMPHLDGGLPGPNMHWDYKDQLQQTDLGGGGTAYYVYDASGQRVRKVWKKTPGLTEERIYLGGFEIFRKHGGPISSNTVTLERESLHIMDDKQRIALVEARSLDTAGNDQAPRQLIRYRFGNHLGSASLELDERAQIISYEEYSPYGSSTYQAVRSQTQTAKRYRYTGKERDEESGLYYYGARYYSPWIGRWTVCDPEWELHTTSSYGYSADSPVTKSDPDGRAPTKKGQLEAASMLAIDEDKSVKSGGSPTDPSNKRFTPQQDNASKGAKSLRDEAKPDKKVIRIKDMKQQGKFDEAATHLLSRNFDETEEMDAITRRAEKKTKDWAKKKGLDPLAPGKKGDEARRAMADKANKRIRAEVRRGKTPEAELIRETLATANVDERLRMRTVDVDKAAQSSLSFKDVRAKVEAIENSKVVVALGNSKAAKVVAAVAPILLSGVAKATPVVGTAFGAADVVNEAQTGSARRATLSAIGMSDMPVVSQAADIGLAVEDAGWVAKDIIDPEQKAEQWAHENLSFFGF